MVRKSASYLLLFLGAFLLVAAIVAGVWAPGAAERTPLNVDTYTYLSGEADKLNPETGELENYPVKYTSHTQADPEKSDGDYVAFVNTKCVNIDENDPSPCLAGTDERVITNTIDTFATDRHTAMATDKTKYLADGAVPHEGLVNKWPFNAEKKTYPYWNGTLGTAVDAEYVGTEDIQGLETYRYDVLVEPTPAEVLPDTQGIYSTNESIWIEPRTGAIVNQTGGQVLKLENGTTILDINVAYTDETVAANVKDTKASVRLLKVITSILPPAAGILGLLGLAGGVLLMRRSRQSSATSAAE
jgi:hypothetical protein